MRFLLFLFVFTISGLSFGQDPVIQLDASIRDDDNGKRMAGVTIEVLKDGAPFVKKTTAGNGKAPLIDLPVGPVYTIKISKAGYVTKIAKIDSYNDFPDELPLFYKQPFETSLFAEVDGVDFHFLETTPMIEFSFDGHGLLGWDKGKLSAMQKKIEALKQEMEKKKKEQEAAAKEAEKIAADIEAYMKAGDAAMKKEDYETAMSQYKAALDLKDDDPTAKSKYNDAKSKYDEQQKNAAAEKAFSEKMEAAKKELDSQNYEPSLALYKEALKLKPDSKLAQDRITEINGIIANAAKLEEDFKKRVAEGDKAVSSKAWDEAIAKYQEALTLKPKDTPTQTKLADAQKKKEEEQQASADAAEKQKKFDDLIAEADKLFDTKDFEKSKAKYEEAAAVIADDPKPPSRIKEIDEILKKLEADKAAQEKLMADYQKLIDEGDAAFKGKDWENAKAKYKSAAALIADKPYPKDQIDLINKEMEKEAALAKTMEEYEQLMSDAKSLFDGEKYEEAKAKYTSASSLMPQESEPKEKIAEINQLLGDLQAAEKLEKEYQDFMQAGNDMLAAKELVSALDKYKKAIGVKPGDAAAQAKIDEVNGLIKEQNEAAEADKLFADYVSKAETAANAKDYSSAKSNYEQALGVKEDAAVRERIKELEKLIEDAKANAELQAKYDAIVKEADDLFAQNSYSDAQAKYEAAQQLIDTDHVKARISDCKIKLGDMAEAAEKEENFKAAVAAGDEAYGNEDWEGALAKYREAIAIKPDPTISNRINEINGKIAEHAANSELEERYQAKLKEADAAFQNQDWDPAKELYNDALNIIEKQYPKDQLKEIDRLLDAEADEKKQAAYQKVIAKADGLRDEDKLDEAISYYERAISFKPDDPYPKEQIEVINKLKEERANAQAADDALDKNYKEFIKKADAAYNTEDWIRALDYYSNALLLKPTEKHPQDRIAELEQKVDLMKEYEAKKAEFDKIVREADAEFESEDYLGSIKTYERALEILPEASYPQTQIELARKREEERSTNEIEQEYQKILTVAQKKFDLKDFDRALELYKRAKDIRPSDPIPQQRIDEINQILENMANLRDNQDEYDVLIRDADHLFEQGKWVKAKSKYTDAFNLINEKYPENQIKLCQKNINGETVKSETEMYNKIIAAADKKFNDKQYLKAKEYYERALGMKPKDHYPKNQLEEIDKLLNPDKYVASAGGMPNRGQPDRSLSSLDAEAMLRDAKEQQDWISSQKAKKQQDDANDLISGLNLVQKAHIIETEDATSDIRTDISETVWSAELDRRDAEVLVTDLEQQMSGTQIIWDENDDDVSEYHRQVIENTYVELRNAKEGAELDRIEFIGDVEIIKIEKSTRESMQANSQEDVVMANKDYVGTQETIQAKDHQKNDLPRMNSEIYVEDFNIQILNKKNNSAWNHEDDVMGTKDMTELLLDERTSNFVGDDIPRIQDVEDMKDLLVDNANVQQRRQSNQQDANMEMRDHAEDMRTDVELNNLNNDIPRQKMETDVENRQDLIMNFLLEGQQDQYNSNQDAKTAVNDLQLKNGENIAKYSDRRVEFEDVVEDFNEDLMTKQSGIGKKTEDNTYSTVDHLEGLTDDQVAYKQQEDKKANDNHEKTVETVEGIIDETSDVSNSTDDHLETSSDYVETLKDLNPNEIDEKMKNQLGAEFPEGVTEEVYTNKDEDGLMLSFVVRRIVVRDGVGNFYEKVQTRFGGVTYTMNGKGITEYQWQNDTEAADLVRN